jgi:hypothetical protein
VGPRARDRLGRPPTAAQHRVAAVGRRRARHARRPPRQGCDGRLGHRDEPGGGTGRGRRRHRLRHGRGPHVAAPRRPPRRPAPVATRDRGGGPRRLRRSPAPDRPHVTWYAAQRVSRGRLGSVLGRLRRPGPADPGPGQEGAPADGVARRRESLHRGVLRRRRRDLGHAPLRLARHRQPARAGTHDDGSDLAAQRRHPRPRSRGVPCGHAGDGGIPARSGVGAGTTRCATGRS